MGVTVRQEIEWRDEEREKMVRFLTRPTGFGGYPGEIGCTAEKAYRVGFDAGWGKAFQAARDHGVAPNSPGEVRKDDTIRALRDEVKRLRDALGIVEFALVDDSRVDGRIDEAGVLGTVRHALGKER